MVFLAFRLKYPNCCHLMSFVAKKDTSAYVNLMFYSFILRNILSTMCTVADIRWLCYTFNILLPRIQAIY